MKTGSTPDWSSARQLNDSGGSRRSDSPIQRESPVPRIEPDQAHQGARIESEVVSPRLRGAALNRVPPAIAAEMVVAHHPRLAEDGGVADAERRATYRLPELRRKIGFGEPDERDFVAGSQSVLGACRIAVRSCLVAAGLALPAAGW